MNKELQELQDKLTSLNNQAIDVIVCRSGRGDTSIGQLHTDHVSCEDLSIDYIVKHEKVLDYELVNKEGIKDTLEANCGSYLTGDMDDDDKMLLVLIA